MPWLPHLDNRVCTPHHRDMVMDGRGCSLPRLLKLSSSPLLGFQRVGGRLLEGPGHGQLCTSLLPDGQTQGGTHRATVFQHDDGCVVTREVCQAWCPRFSSEAASGWGPTGPFNRCLLNQEVNLDVEGSVQGHASGNRAPPRSMGLGHKSLHMVLPRPWLEC